MFFSGESQETLNNNSDPFRFSDDSFGNRLIMPDFFTFLKKQIAVIDNSVYGIVNFMGHAGGQLANGRQMSGTHGFSLKELTGVSPARSKGRTKNPPKYRHPENPEITWTGRGRKPQWIKDAESEGKDISAFEM